MAIPTIPVEGKVKPVVPKVTAPKPVVPMDQASKDARFVRDMEANKSLHDAGRLQHYVDIQKNNPNAVFGNEDLKRFYNQKVGVPTAQPTAPPPPIAPPGQPPTAPQAPQAFDESAYRQGVLNDSKSYLDNIYNAQQQAQLAQLKASRDKAIGQVNLQDAQLAPQYAGMRNQADVVSQQNVDRLRELMDSMGLHGSGENVSATVGLQSARQDALNSLNTQEQQQHNDFAQRIADLNDPAQEQSMLAALETERSKAMYDAYNRAGDQAYQRGRDNTMDNRYNSETAYSHGRDALGDQRYTDETTYSHGRDAVGDQRYNSETTYTHGQDAIANKRADEAAKAAAIQQSKDNAWREHTFNNMSASEKAQLAKDVSQFGETKAWEMFQLKYNGELAKAQSKAQIAALTP